MCQKLKTIQNVLKWRFLCHLVPWSRVEILGAWSAMGCKLLICSLVLLKKISFGNFVVDTLIWLILTRNHWTNLKKTGYVAWWRSEEAPLRVTCERPYVPSIRSCEMRHVMGFPRISHDVTYQYRGACEKCDYTQINMILCDRWHIWGRDCDWV